MKNLLPLLFAGLLLCLATCIRYELPTEIKIYNLLLEVGETGTIDIEVKIPYTYDKTIKWTSSDEEIAKVNSRGMVSAEKEGEATITATTVNGIESTCIVTVVREGFTIPATDITLDSKSLSLKTGVSKQLLATITPANATTKDVKWTSSDNSIATVDRTGKVLAIAKGVAAITATTVRNPMTAACIITVGEEEPSAPVTGITLNKEILSMRDRKSVV